MKKKKNSFLNEIVDEVDDLKAMYPFLDVSTKYRISKKKAKTSAKIDSGDCTTVAT